MRLFPLTQLLLVFVAAAFILGCNSGHDKAAEATPPPAPAPVSSGQFLNLSDIHFFPFYDPALTPQLAAADISQWKTIFESSTIKTNSVYHEDCNYPLFASALSSMKQEIPNPDFIMISGDFLAHEFESTFETQLPISHAQDAAEGYVKLHAFIEKTIRFMAMMVDETYPNTPVYACLGNNDAYCGDYMIQPNGQFLQMLSEVWKPMLRGSDEGTFSTTFPAAGYYAAKSPVNNKLNFIVLNTILLSSGFNQTTEPFCTPGNFGPDNADPGNEMFAWLTTQLEACRTNGEKAWMVQHIPPGINVYPSKPSGTQCVGDTSYWFSDAFNTKYLEMVREYADVIAVNMAGHYHKDDFRIVMDEGGTTPVSYLHILPSISPIYFNNPGYEVVDYDPATGELLDYHVYYVSVANTGTNRTWQKEYSFGSAYGQTSVNAQTLTAAHMQAKTDLALQEKYSMYYPVSDTSTYHENLPAFKAFWCAQYRMTKKDYAACLCETTAKPAAAKK